MKRILLCVAVALVALSPAPTAEAKKTAKQGLAELHELIGSWKCTGNPANKKLTFERTDEKTKQGERLVFQLLHHNRYVLYFEERPADSKSFTQQYRVGSTKEGVPFASVDKGPECIVSGGLGTMTVSYKGKTYHVCCSGCRDAFRDEPEKYIKEYEEAKKKKKD